MTLLGCANDAQSLLVLPKGYLDKRVVHTSIHSGPENRPCLWEARIKAAKALDKHGNITRSPYPAQLDLELIFECGTVIESKIFGVTEAWRSVEAGDAITFTAELSQKPWGWSLFGILLASLTGRVHPIYVGVPGKISGDVIEQFIDLAIADPANIRLAVEMIAGNPVVKRRIMDHGLTPASLLRGLHRPDTPQMGDKALYVARAASVAEIKWAAQSGAVNKGAAVHNIDTALISAVAGQAEKLSRGQRYALNEIRKAVNQTLAAKMLLNGDVGSGKTLVFMLAAASVAKTYSQRVAIMVPSEIVANQIFKQAVVRFPELNPVLLTAGAAQVLGDSLLVIEREYACD